MTLNNSTGLYFWGFLLAYAGLMYVVSPRTRTVDGFFYGVNERGIAVSQWSLAASIFISWIFAKSVTNAANLGAEYGIVGGLAYATYWLSIPVAGVVIYRLRTRYAATGLVSFLVSKYGRMAALAFTVAVLIRLYNEVWSNTSVVGSYFGNPGDMGYIAAALFFTLATLLYSMKGGLRSSIITDSIQALIFLILLVLLLPTIIPEQGVTALASAGEFSLTGGVDLILVALLQVLSYPFHDPILTDRGFLNHEKHMLRAFVLAGVLGFICILAFSLIGVHAYLNDLQVNGNAPAVVAQSLGIVTLFVVTVIMMSSAGSTLDSTFSSLSKSFAYDTPALLGKDIGSHPIRIGLWVMVIFALLGNLPMLAGTDILKATTISGTMVMGLAPVFLLQHWVKYSPASFHLSFWPGLVLGLLLAIGQIPASWAIGEGDYALLLGANLYGLAICTLGYLLPIFFSRMRNSENSSNLTRQK